MFHKPLPVAKRAAVAASARAWGWVLAIVSSAFQAFFLVAVIADDGIAPGLPFLWGGWMTIWAALVWFSYRKPLDAAGEETRTGITRYEEFRVIRLFAPFWGPPFLVAGLILALTR